MQSKDTEKFYDTYGKNASFEPLIEEKPAQVYGVDPALQKRTVFETIKKYLMVTVFLAIVTTFIFVGGVVLLSILGLMLIGMLIRTLLFGPSKSSSSFMIIKK